jgi:hypothetical protein
MKQKNNLTGALTRSGWSVLISFAKREGWLVVHCDSKRLVLRKPGWPEIASGVPGSHHAQDKHETSSQSRRRRNA